MRAGEVAVLAVRERPDQRPLSPSARASCGRCSQIWMPGTAVAIGLNSPRISAGASGFMSSESRWLRPPVRFTRMTDWARVWRAESVTRKRQANRGARPDCQEVAARKHRKQGHEGSDKAGNQPAGTESYLIREPECNCRERRRPEQLRWKCARGLPILSSQGCNRAQGHRSDHFQPVSSAAGFSGQRKRIRRAIPSSQHSGHALVMNWKSSPVVDSIARPHFRQERLMEKPVGLAWSGESSFGGMRGISRLEDGPRFLRSVQRSRPMSGNPPTCSEKGWGVVSAKKGKESELEMMSRQLSASQPRRAAYWTISTRPWMPSFSIDRAL